MINLDQIDEWIQEVEQRPTSAPVIIRYVAGRLRDLSKRNEELLADNIELRSGRKVEEYESRIANLEYQLDILKRQMGGDNAYGLPSPAVEMLSLLAYTIKGRILRIEIPLEGLNSGDLCAQIPEVSASDPVRLLVTNAAEELLFVFDSGRAIALPVSEIATADTSQLDWKQAYLVEPHGGEQLTVVLPVGRMTLFDYCIQTSRRGCAKKMMKSAFESHISKNFVGAGTKTKSDKTCDLALAGKDDQLVIATREGFLWSMDISQLPYTIEEVLKLSATDYIASSFVINKKPSLLILTGNGKVIHRETGWLEKANSFKGRGQPAFSQARRDAGIRIAGAAAVDENDWGAALSADGRLTLHKITDLISAGTLYGQNGDEESAANGQVLEFTTFALPGTTKA